MTGATDRFHEGRRIIDKHRAGELTNTDPDHFAAYSRGRRPKLHPAPARIPGVFGDHGEAMYYEDETIEWGRTRTGSGRWGARVRSGQ